MVYTSNMIILSLFNSSMVTFTDVYVGHVIPKAFYDDSSKSYHLNVTVCLIIPKPISINVTMATNLTGTTIPTIRKVTT